MSRGSVNFSAAKIGVKKEPRTGEKPIAAGIFPISRGFSSARGQFPKRSHASL
jgi:hypothetical protein